LDQGIAHRFPLTMQGEDHSMVIPVVFFPPAYVGNALVGIFVGQVIEVVIRDADRETVPTGDRRQTPWNGPRSQHSILFEAKVIVMLGAPMLMQHEVGATGCWYRVVQ
jgi:hypothetical protein